MKRTMLILAIATIASAPAMAKGPISPEVFRDSYNAHAKDLLPALQTTQCRTISAAKEPGKAILECQTVANNTLLSINGMNKRFDGAWLMLDASALPHPSDLTRAGGLLLRVAKGYHYGNHLALAQEAIIGAQRSKGKQSCIDDPASGSRLCVSTDNGTIYNMILEQAEPKKG